MNYRVTSPPLERLGSASYGMCSALLLHRSHASISKPWQADPEERLGFLHADGQSLRWHCSIAIAITRNNDVNRLAVVRNAIHMSVSTSGPTCACSPTPLRGPKIVAILARRFGLIVFPIYCGGAADAQPVGPS